MTILIIVESPSKCKKIESYLGNGYKCIATYGHFRSLESLKDIKITNDNLTINFSTTKGKEKNISTMSKEIKKASKKELIKSVGKSKAKILYDFINSNSK